MNEHVIELLSEYLDEELNAADRARVDAHLRTCAECAATLADLRHVIATAARVAATDRAPSRDLWGVIEARIERIPAPQPRRISFSIPQLAAAAVLLMALSAATAWFVRDTTTDSRPTSVEPVIQAEMEPRVTPDAVRPVNFADAQYDAAVADLERALDERRNDLNPRTVEILERNLRLIDAAIAQARQALEDDPGNSYLNRHLVESRRRKLDLLRRATAITEGN